MWTKVNGMTIHICGSFTSRKKPCKCCESFCLYGTSYGYCVKHEEDMSCNDHCKYYKRDSYTYNKNGKLKKNRYEY